jgi:hypothetical protein
VLEVWQVGAVHPSEQRRWGGSSSLKSATRSLSPDVQSGLSGTDGWRLTAFLIASILLGLRQRLFIGEKQCLFFSLNRIERVRLVKRVILELRRSLRSPAWDISLHLTK